MIQPSAASSGLLHSVRQPCSDHIHKGFIRPHGTNSMQQALAYFLAKIVLCSVFSNHFILSVKMAEI